MTSIALPLAARAPRGLRAVAWIGITLGLLGCWIALPPITARSWVWSLVVCLIAVMLGVGVVIRGERRFGGFAIASGVLGFTVGYLATLSGVGKLETVVVWSALIASTFGSRRRWSSLRSAACSVSARESRTSDSRG